MLSSRKRAYLSEMGIEQWQLIHPERMQGIDVVKQALADSIRLIVVNPEPFTHEDITFLANVLKSFEVTLDEAVVTQPHLFSRLGEHQASWVWFIGCEQQQTTIKKQLTSPRLGEVSADPALKKALWQQILQNKER